MRVDNLFTPLIALASLSLARPWHNTSSLGYGTGLIGTAPGGTDLVRASSTSAAYTNSSSAKYFQSTRSTVATVYGPNTIAYGLSDLQAAGVFSSIPSSADGCSVSYITVFASQTTESSTPTDISTPTETPTTPSLPEQYSYAINSGTTSWFDDQSPSASEYGSTVLETTIVVVTPPATTEAPVSITSDSATRSIPASSSSDSASLSTVSATAFSTDTVNVSASTESSTQSTFGSPPSLSSDSDVQTITKTDFTTHTITHTRTGVTTDDISTANSTSWQWASLTGPSVSVTSTANTTTPIIIIPTITKSLISPSTITVTASDFPSLSPSGSEGLSFSGVLSPQISATILLSTSSTKGSRVIPASSTEDSLTIASSSLTAPATYTPFSTGNAVSTVHGSSSLSSYPGTGAASSFGIVDSSIYIASSTTILISPPHTANATTPCESSTNFHSALIALHSNSSITAYPSSTDTSPALSSESSSSSHNHTYMSTSSTEALPALVSESSSSSYNHISMSTSSIEASPTRSSESSGGSYNHTSMSTSSTCSLTLASSTSSLSASFTPTVNTTASQSATAPSSTSCGELGNYTINWDDEPLFVPPKNSNTTFFPPVFSPYHHLFYANGFAYVVPSVDGLKEPFPATSNPNIAIFMPDLVIDATAKNHSVINFTGLLPGEISAGPRASDQIWEFDAYGADLGCDNVGYGPCKMMITGYAYDTTTQSEFAVAQQMVELPPCDTATLHNCSLKHVDFDGFHGLSGIQFEAIVGNQQKIFVMDNLNLGWCDNSCPAGLKRFNFGKN